MFLQKYLRFIFFFSRIALKNIKNFFSFWMWPLDMFLTWRLAHAQFILVEKYRQHHWHKFTLTMLDRCACVQTGPVLLVRQSAAQGTNPSIITQRCQLLRRGLCSCAQDSPQSVWSIWHCPCQTENAVLTLKVYDLHNILLLIVYCTVYRLYNISVIQHAMLTPHARLIHQVIFSYQLFSYNLVSKFM